MNVGDAEIFGLAEEKPVPISPANIARLEAA